MFQVTHTFLAARASPSVSWGSSTVSTRQERAASSAAPSAPCLPFSLPVSTKWAHRSGQLIFIYSPKAPCAQDSSEGSPDFIFNFTSQRCINNAFQTLRKVEQKLGERACTQHQDSKTDVLHCLVTRPAPRFQ